MTVADSIRASFNYQRELAEALVDNITGIFRRDEPRTTSDEIADMQRQRDNSPADVAGMFKVQKERRNVVETCRDMYEEDGRAKKILQTLARDATKNGFTITVTNDDGAQEAIDALVKRLQLDSRLDDWCRLTFRDGDTFLEVGVSDALNIERITRKPTLNMYRNSDESDRFEDPTQAFYYTDKPWITKPRANNVLWFAEWQIIHARWDHDEGNRYGKPLLASSRGPWKRVKEGEIDIAVRRKTRAGMKYVHSIDGDPADVEKYKEQNKAALNNPLAAVVDLFHNKKVDVQAIQGDARLSEIDDVKHHIKTFWLPSPVPMDLVGYGEDIDFSVIGHQKEQYDETLEAVQGWVAGQLLVPLFERQWLLAGILPDDLDYEIKWATKQQLKPEDVEKIARAVAQFRALGASDEFIAAIITQFLPGIDPALLFAALDGEEENVERLVNIANTLMRSFSA